MALRTMTQGMVDRLFWRAGFGANDEIRRRWAGKPLGSAVTWLLATPQSLAGAEPTNNGRPLDPRNNDTDLVLAWLDRMVRAQNPLHERLTFLWHRHFASSRDDVSPPQLMLRQNDLFRRYGDLAASPDADFRALAHEVTEDPAMLRFLTGELNVKGRPNENYARELMELFTLGVADEQGRPNYSEDDVKELARALSGWRIDTTNPDAPRSFLDPSRFDDGPKSFLGRSGAFDDRGAVDVVLAHPAHPRFLLRKLWGEFVQSPPDEATLADLADTYLRQGMRIRPVVRKILLHPLLFESPDEPNMIKPPVVYVAGAMRALGLGVTSSTPVTSLAAMGQRPYFPPDVSGWEYGPAWLTTNTALQRFRFAAAMVTSPQIAPQDVPFETPAQAYERAHQATARPWASAATKAALVGYATRAPGSTPRQRLVRQLVLRTLMLAGPDGQVM